MNGSLRGRRRVWRLLESDYRSDAGSEVSGRTGCRAVTIRNVRDLFSRDECGSRLCRSTGRIARVALLSCLTVTYSPLQVHLQAVSRDLLSCTQPREALHTYTDGALAQLMTVSDPLLGTRDFQTHQ
ncbi:hypothetical protein CSUI_008600 [Cystoisospora suis]|uniref:Uncharacterized protein n=1 Tax=Cystoisospora suis TaxID=483139 RepID=A0A2C6KKC0_9APIC|nr:hypothetical protein CSUI_008600 [Cystoisospora suis]